jgi:actin related protein 2/3 complex subunit 3
MPSYHSMYNGAGFTELCGLPVLPLKTKVRGPAPTVDPPTEEEDVVDEALRLFRANLLFRNFELQGGGDRLLVYLTLFIHACLKRAAARAGKAEGARELAALAAGAHLAPGDAAWPLAQVIPAPKSAADLEALKGYLRQLRECVAARLVDRIYGEDGAQNRHWMQYAKRKGFMGKEFP